MIAALRSRRRQVLPRPAVAEPEPPACTSVLVHGVATLAIRYTCTVRRPHRVHEHRPRPGRMSVAEWA